MFSFRKDKMGFFNGLVLMVIVGLTLVLTVLLWAIWGWDHCGTAIKVIWGTAWVLCIIMVLVRVYVFKYQREKAERQKAEADRKDESAPQNRETHP